MNFFNKLFSPTLFGKYLNNKNNGYFGLGADFIYEIGHAIKLFGGISSFEKPRTIWEERFILPSLSFGKQKITSTEFFGLFETSNIKATVGYFSQSTNNTLMPAIVKSDLLKKDYAVFYTSKDLSLQGINLKFDFKFWKILLSSNTSYYPSETERHNYSLPDVTSQGGIYYIDTLFNNSLELKTGVNYYSIGHRDYSIIDFEKNISTNYIYSTTTKNSSLISASQAVPKVQLDFFLSGRIRKSAMIYFVFENLFNEQYSIVPFYPKQERGLRFGVAWEFLD